MPRSVVLKFSDPYEYQRRVRASETNVFLTAPGEYRSELTQIDLERLWMQSGRTSLPHIAHTVAKKERSPIYFLADDRQAPIFENGLMLVPGQIVVSSSGAEHHRRASPGNRWRSMSLTPEDLAAAGRAIAGFDVAAPSATRLIRPPPHLMSRLLQLHNSATHLAASVPDILAHPQVARAIEQELVRAMVECLTETTDAGTTTFRHQRGVVMRRFQQLLEADQDRPLYLTEICAAIGVSDRTLRLHCAEFLGMSPHRYLWLRRMHLVRRALNLAEPSATTVTAVANDHGFGELGRFAVMYKKLFGESPSAALRRRPDCPPLERNRRSVNSEFAIVSSAGAR